MVGTIGLESFIAGSGITSSRLVLVHFEILQILMLLKDKYLFSTPLKIYAMVRKVKKQNNFILSSLIT